MSAQALQLGPERHLFAIRELPATEFESTAVVILSAGVLHSAGPFRLHVTFSNRLSVRGFPVMRVDQSGKGESPRRPGMSRTDTVLADYDALYADLQGIGIEKVVLIGLCWGADDAIYIASQRDSIVGIVALDGFAQRNAGFYARYYFARALSFAAWWRLLMRTIRRSEVSSDADPDEASINNFALRDWPEFSEMVRRHCVALNKGVRFLGVFSHGQSYYNHKGQLAANLPADCDKRYLTEVYYADADHTFSLTAHRERLVDLIENWICSEFGSEESG